VLLLLDLGLGGVRLHVFELFVRFIEALDSGYSTEITFRYDYLAFNVCSTWCMPSESHHSARFESAG
jgi:hypothetical protein